MSVGVLTTDLGLVVLSWDAALERMTGIRAADAKGRSLEDIVPSLAFRPALELLREPLVSGALQVLAPAIHKNLIPCPPLEPSAVFTEMQQRVVAGALRDEARVVGLVITIEDVTKRIELEREVAAKLRDADPATRLAAVNRLAAGGPTGDLGPLGSAMRDEHWQVRHAAVRALAERSDLDLVEALVTALREGHRDFSLLSSAL